MRGFQKDTTLGVLTVIFQALGGWVTGELLVGVAEEDQIMYLFLFGIHQMQSISARKSKKLKFFER